MDYYLQKEPEVKGTTRSADKTNDDLAQIMNYLRSATLWCRLDVLPDRLVDYPRWSQLSRVEANELLCKVIHHDEDKDICQPPYEGPFLTLSEATSLVAVTRTAAIGGTSRTSSKLFVFQTSWIVKNYIEPMRRGKARLDRISIQLTTHCNQCQGRPSECSCTSGCRRYPWASCTPPSRATASCSRLAEVLERLAEVTTDDTDAATARGRPRRCDHCEGLESKCECDSCPTP